MSESAYLENIPVFPSKETDDPRCSQCAFCCTYMAVPIDGPEDRDTISSIIWYLYHQDVRVYKDDEGEWYLQFWTRCEALRPDGLCGVYETRPDVCEDFTADDCEVTNDDIGEEVGFDTAHEFVTWLKKAHPRRYKWAKGVKGRRDLTRAPKRQLATRNATLLEPKRTGPKGKRNRRAAAAANGHAGHRNGNGAFSV